MQWWHLWVNKGSEKDVALSNTFITIIFLHPSATTPPTHPHPSPFLTAINLTWIILFFSARTHLGNRSESQTLLLLWSLIDLTKCQIWGNKRKGTSCERSSLGSCSIYYPQYLPDKFSSCLVVDGFLSHYYYRPSPYLHILSSLLLTEATSQACLIAKPGLFNLEVENKILSYLTWLKNIKQFTHKFFNSIYKWIHCTL